MKQLLSGNEAIARGAYEAGISVAFAYPGTPSTEILENIVQYKPDIYANWGCNEKTAMEEAIGASFTGARALVTMKHVGLNVAADPFFSASYIGATGALIVVSADDPGMHSSQNEQDNRHYAIAAKVPVLEPSDSQEAKELVKEAVKISEQFNTPVLIRMTTRVCHSRSIVELGERETPPVINYQSEFSRRTILPAIARRMHREVEERQKKIADFSNTFAFNKIIKGKSRIGVVASGISYQYCREVFQDAWFLKVTLVYPFPEKLYREFAGEVDEIYVFEENDPILENFIRLLTPEKKIYGKDIFPLVGENSQDTINFSLNKKSREEKFDISKIPQRPPALCPGCPHTGLFFTLSRMNVKATGDIGCYTLGALKPLNVIDTCVDMGASITALVGMEVAMRKADKPLKQVAVIGDSTFLHSGITGLIDFLYNNCHSCVIILDNSITAMTGHQQHPGTGKNLMGESTKKVDLYNLIRNGLGIENTYLVDGYDLKLLKETLKAEMLKPEPSVIIVRRPCVLLFRKIEWSPMQVNAEKCTKCHLCLKIGCPAISSNGNGKARIDEALCTGCTLCAQACPAKAIEFVDPEGKHIKDQTLES